MPHCIIEYSADVGDTLERGDIFGTVESVKAASDVYLPVGGKIVEINDLLKGQIFVAHDVDFDYMFLKTELKKAGFDLNEPKVCTIKLSEKMYPEAQSYSLGKLCKALEIHIPEEDRHRAAGDALATTKLLGLLLSSED